MKNKELSETAQRICYIAKNEPQHIAEHLIYMELKNNPVQKRIRELEADLQATQDDTLKEIIYEKISELSGVLVAFIKYRRFYNKAKENLSREEFKELEK